MDGIVNYGDPNDVKLDYTSAVGMDISSDGFACRNSFNCYFGSARANRCVTKGTWYFEVELGTSGLHQIGWCTKDCQFLPDEAEGKGVGDDEFGWAVDLYRGCVWHQMDDNNPDRHYAPDVKWKAGDILQCYLDLDKKEMSFGLNGTNLGVAFTVQDITNIGDGLYPAVSMTPGNYSFFNFGKDKFAHQPQGYKPFCEARKQ